MHDSQNKGFEGIVRKWYDDLRLFIHAQYPLRTNRSLWSDPTE